MNLRIRTSKNETLLRFFAKEAGEWSLHAQGKELVETTTDGIITPRDDVTATFLKESPEIAALFQPIKGKTTTYRILFISEATMEIQPYDSEFKFTLNKKLTRQEWDKCRDKAAASVDQRMVGVAGVETAIRLECGIPPVDETGTDSGVGIHPYDLVRSKKWKEKFVRITEEKYQAFVDRFAVASETRLEEGWIIGEGMAPHSGGSNAAAFAIYAASGRVFGVMIEDGTRLAGFGFGSSWQGAPQALQTWVRKHGGG